MKRRVEMRGMLAVLLFAVSCAQETGAQAHDPAQHGAAVAGGKRTAVKFPQALKDHTLSNMRDHLFALQQIQEALAARAYDRAATIAEQRLGMSSLELHGAHDVEKFMPAGMQRIGSEMHRAASQFAVAAANAGATGDPGPPLSALARVVQQCVACHASYQMQ